MSTIARIEGLRGLYAGLGPAILGSTLSWGLYFFFYSRAKQRYLKKTEDQLGPGLHLVSSAEAGALVCLFTNPVWLIKTRLQLQTPLQQTRQYSGFSGLILLNFRYNAVRTILKEEGWHALYRGIGPSLLLVSHGALQFMFYEESRKALIRVKSNEKDARNRDNVLVMRSRLQQRPSCDGSHKYSNILHLVKETLRFEGIRGFYRGITPSLAKNIPAASITFVVYEKVYSLLRSTEDLN
ncbi:Folate transporter 1 [Nymphaea thermarum]|nr:Folate transporter 1 [Nymphaea thermarum]